MAFWKVLKPERSGEMGVGSKMATGFVVQHGAPPYTSSGFREVTRLISNEVIGFLRKMTRKLQGGIGLNQEGNWIEAIIQEKSP